LYGTDADHFTSMHRKHHLDFKSETVRAKGWEVNKTNFVLGDDPFPKQSHYKDIHTTLPMDAE